MAVSLAELLGALHRSVKTGAVANNLTASNDLANWIMTNLYDTERFKGENRAVILAAVRQAAAHYKGDI